MEKPAEKDIQFKTITDSIPVLIAYIDKDLRYRFANKTFESWHERKLENVYGKHIQEIIGDKAWSVMHGYIERSLQGETVNYEERIVYKNNKTRYVRGTLMPHSILDGSEVEGVYVLLSDITEEKRFEESLRKSEDRYGALFENVPLGICINTTDGRIVAYNPALQKITGYTRKDMENARTKQFYSNQYERERLLKELRDRGSLKNYQIDLKRRNGETFNAMLNIVPHNIAGETMVLTVIQDVTEQKKDRDALLESERRFSNIINFLPDATFAIDSEGRVIAWNRAIEEMTGVKAVNILGKDNHEHSIPFYGKRQPILADLVLKPDREAEKKYSFITREMDRFIAESISPLKVNGKHIYIWAKASPIYDIDGNITGVIQSIRDITEQKQAEKKLIESEERYRTAIEYSNDGVAIVKGSMHLYVNQRFCDIFGFDSPEDVIGKTHAINTHPDDLKRVQEINARRQRGEEVPKKYEFKGIGKDGAIVYVEVSATNTTYRGEQVTLAYLRDVTERKLVSDALRDSEMKYRAIFDNANDAIFLMDRDVFIDCNKKALSVFGCSKEEIIGQPPYKFSPDMQPDGSDSTTKAMKKIRAALRGEPQFFDWQHQKLDGTIFDAVITLNALELEGKKYIQAIIRDNTIPKK